MNQAQKQLFLAAMLLALIANTASAQVPKIVVVGDLASYDQQLIDFINAHVTVPVNILYTEDRYQEVVGDATKIAELTSADLIVVSRNAVSANYDSTLTSPTETTFWNSIPVPLVSYSMFQTRTGGGTAPRWHWVASNGNVAAQAFTSMVVRTGQSSDTLLAGVTITSNTVQLFTAPQQLRWFNGQQIMANTNATSYIARAHTTGPGQFDQDDGPILIRWSNTSVPFHAGTTETPAAKRIYFGIFDDTAGQTPASTPSVVQVNNLTADGVTIMVNILKELAPQAFTSGPNSSSGWTIYE